MMTKSVSGYRIRLLLMIVSIITAAAVSSSCLLISAFDQTGGKKELQELDFSLFSDSVASDSLSLHFAVKDPVSLKLTVPEVSLGDVSKEKSDELYASSEEYLTELEKINYDKLSREDKIIYDVILYDLEESLAYKDFYYYSSPFNSITGLQTELPLVLSEYNFETQKDVDDYLLLLKDMKRYYSDLMDFENERADEGFAASDENLQKIIDSCESFLEDQEDHFLVSSFTERLEIVDGLTKSEKSDYIDQNQSVLDEYVFPAYELLIDGFGGLMGSGENDGGLSGLPDGRDYYELLLKTRTSSDASVKTVTRQIEDAVSEAIDTIQATPYDVDFEESYNTYNFSEGSVQDNLDYCESAVDEDFPDIMDHSVTLKQVPGQLEDFFSPAAYLSCRIDDPTDNLILTNNAALADYQNVLETIAHEGYPGHMYEAIYHAQNTTSYYQRSASFIGYSEGWAEYAAEYIMENSEYDQTLVTYIASENQIFNILFPSRIDIGVNYEGWTREDTYDYLSGYNLDMQEFADYCYDMAIEIPGYYMPYCIGHLNTDEILADAADELDGAASLLEIHEAYLDIGPAPFPVVSKYMDIYIENQQE